MQNRYQFRFQPGALLLFLLVMAPTFFWLAVPAPNDILRDESVTPALDTAGSTLQVLFIAALCLLARKGLKKHPHSPLLFCAVLCVLLYYAGWAFYYLGSTNTLVVLLLTLPPCAVFLVYAVYRRNIIALVPAAGFTLCHILYAAVNFIL